MTSNFWLDLPRPFFVLAPMEDVTDVVFRHVVSKAGRPDVFFTLLLAMAIILVNKIGNPFIVCSCYSQVSGGSRFTKRLGHSGKWIQYTAKHLTEFESCIYKTTSTVIDTEDCVIVVDPCLLPSEIDEINQHVMRMKGTRPIYLIMTHSDWDHIVGAGAFPEALNFRLFIQAPRITLTL